MMREFIDENRIFNRTMVAIDIPGPGPLLAESNIRQLTADDRSKPNRDVLHYLNGTVRDGEDYLRLHGLPPSGKGIVLSPFYVNDSDQIVSDIAFILRLAKNVRRLYKKHSSSNTFSKELIDDWGMIAALCEGVNLRYVLKFVATGLKVRDAGKKGGSSIQRRDALNSRNELILEKAHQLAAANHLERDIAGILCRRLSILDGYPTSVRQYRRILESRSDD